MYLKEKTVKLLGIKNIILTIFGVLCILLDGSYIVSEFVYYRNDPDTALHAVSMATSIRGTVMGVILLIATAISRRWIGSATFYSSYFEGDLSGYITYRDLAEVTGKKVKKIRRQLRLFRRLYMKNYEQKGEGGKELVELYSKTSLCECKNCGAHIEKRVFFTGICPYCGSTDLFAKVLTEERFYSISNEFEAGIKKPDYYKARRLKTKKTLFGILLALGAFVAIIMLMLTLSDLSHYFDQEYQKKILLSPENHLYSYDLIKADILDSAIYSGVVFLILAPLALLRARKMVNACAADTCAEFFAKCQIPFVKAEKLPAIGRTSDKKRKLRLVRGAIRRGYLIHCTLEAHDGELMAALAKRIVKDQCPSCGASIVGAVDENYVCSYCGNMIMGVIEKKW